MQATVRAGRRRFIEALVCDAAAVFEVRLSPYLKPAAAINISSSIGGILVAHGRDMLTHTDIHRAILRVPAPPPEVPTADLGLESSEGPPAPTGSARDRRGKMWEEDDETGFKLHARQLLNFEDGQLAAEHPKAVVQVQVREFTTCPALVGACIMAIITSQQPLLLTQPSRPMRQTTSMKEFVPRSSFVEHH
jgi:hypothetical protein